MKFEESLIAGPSRLPMLIVTIVWIVGWYSIVFVFDAEQVGRLTREDGLVEYTGAALFLLASILFFASYVKSRAASGQGWLPIKGNVFFLLLGLAFLFVFLEEISWGQRIFGFATPETLRDLNSQSEFNFHNLQVFHGETETGERKSFLALLLNMDRMFSMFWFTYCFLMPIAYRYSTQVRNLLNRMQMPIVPIFLGVVFVLNYAITKVLELQLGSGLHHAVVETKESNLAMLFVAVAIWFLSNGRTPESGVATKAV